MINELAHRWLFTVLWLTWAAYWWLSGRNVKPVERIESAASRQLHIWPLFIAMWLLWLPHVPVLGLETRLYPWAEWQFWLGAALTLAGLAFTFWARFLLGRNWSGMVTVKQDHELVTAGPYALVRHPIYTGLLLAIAGSALARGEVRGLVALALALAAILRKRLTEERFMRERFGAAYTDYAARVPALVPWLF